MRKTITLTHDQAVMLVSYLLMTTNYRDGEKKAWEALSKELKKDGTPEYPNAKSNYEFWVKMGAAIEEIKEIIDNAKLEED